MPTTGKEEFVRPIKQGVAISIISLLIVVSVFGLYSARRVVLLFLIGLGAGVVLAPIFPLAKQWLRLPRAATAFVALVRSGTTVMIRGLFVIAVAVYTAIDIERFKTGFLLLFPISNRQYASHLMSETAETLRHWTVAQLIVMFCVGGFTSLSLLLIGMNNWISYGILAGILNVIPYVGPFVTGAILLLVALGSQPDLALWVLGAFVVIQQVESYLIVPMVMKGKIAIPPVYLLALIFMMGKWFGLIGVFVASPVLAVGRRLFLLTHVPRMDRDNEGCSN